MALNQNQDKQLVIEERPQQVAPGCQLPVNSYMEDHIQQDNMRKQH